MNAKRFSKIPIYDVFKQNAYNQHENSQKIQKVIIFENIQCEKCLIVFFHKSDYQIIKFGDSTSNEIILAEGNILEILKMNIQSIKNNKFKNEIYLIEYSSQPYIFFLFDDNFLHEINLLEKKILKTIQFQLSNSFNVQNTQELLNKQDHQRYILERKALLHSSIQIIPLNKSFISILQSRFQNYSFSQVSVYDQKGQLVLRESITGYRDKFDRGLFLGCYLSNEEHIFFVQECILEEPIKLLCLDVESIYNIKIEDSEQIQQESDQTSLNYFQRYLKKQENKQNISSKLSVAKYHNQVIDMRQIDSFQLIIFMNTNEKQTSYDSCYLIYDTQQSMFNQEIIFDNFEYPIIINRILCLNQLFQKVIFEFISSKGLHIAEYGLVTKQIANCQKVFRLGFNQYDFGNNQIENTLQFQSSEVCYFDIDEDQQVIYKNQLVGLSHSLIFLMQKKEITEQISQIAIYDIFLQLDLIQK
ncbi:hypothetical protein ABPG72_015393 [Tetrahymena utriculariae]